MAGDVRLMFRLLGDSSSAEQSFDNVDQAREKTGEGFGKLKMAGAAAGLAAGAAIAAGLLAGMEKEKALDKLSAQIGAGSPMAADAGKVAGELYAEAYGESVGAAAEAVRSVLQGGLLDEDASQAEIKAVTASVMDLASAFDTEVSDATNAVAQLIRNGLAPDAKSAMDIITRGFQQGVDKSKDFLVTLNEYGTQFRSMGLDGATAVALMAQGIKAGARDADVVADAIKEFSIEAVRGGEAVQKGFANLGLNAKQMTADLGAGGERAAAALDLTLDSLRSIEDPVKRNAVAVELFGTKAEDLGQALYALDPSIATLGDVAGAAVRMGDELNDNAATKVEAFKRRSITAFGDLLVNGVNVLLEGGERLSGWFDTATQEGGDLAGAVDGISEVVSGLVGWVKGELIPTLERVGGGVITSLRGSVKSLTEAFHDHEGAVHAVSTIFKVVGLYLTDIMLPVLGEVIKLVGAVLTPVFRVLASTIEALFPVFQGLAIFFLEQAGVIIKAAAAAFGWVPGLGPKLEQAAAEFEEFKSKVNASLRGIQSHKVVSIDVLVNGQKGTVSDIGGGTYNISVGGRTVRALATGGIVTQPTQALIGEGGEPEMVMPLSKAKDMGFGGGGGDTYVIQPQGLIVGDETTLARALERIVQGARGQGVKVNLATA